MDLLRILIAILLPPLGVFLQVGFAGAFWLNILLTLLGYIPGLFMRLGNCQALAVDFILLSLYGWPLAAA